MGRENPARIDDSMNQMALASRRLEIWQSNAEHVRYLSVTDVPTMRSSTEWACNKHFVYLGPEYQREGRARELGVTGRQRLPLHRPILLLTAVLSCGLLHLSGLNLPLSSTSAKIRDFLSQFCSGWRWIQMVDIIMEKKYCYYLNSSMQIF